jgi:transposase-like protein
MSNGEIGKMKTAGALLGVPECSGGERSEPERNGGTPSSEAPADGGAQQRWPDPEVLETPKRRQFSAEYKARIVQEADLCTQWGQVGAVLRREGLHWSQLRKWRSIFRKAVHTALKDDKRGRKCAKHPLESENERLRKQIGRLEHRLRQAETIIDVQKKISEILGIPLKDSESGEDD